MVADAPKPTAEGPDEQAPFENLLGRLAEIAKELESEGVPLEKALSLFEEGVRLSRLAQSRLDRAEARIEELVGAGRTRPLETPADKRSR